MCIQNAKHDVIDADEIEGIVKPIRGIRNEIKKPYYLLKKRTSREYLLEFGCCYLHVPLDLENKADSLLGTVKENIIRIEKLVL